MKIEIVEYKSSEYWALLDKGYEPALIWFRADGVEMVRMELDTNAKYHRQTKKS